MKLVSTKTELAIFKTMVGRNKLLRGTIMSTLDSHYFHNTFIKEAYLHALAVNKSAGQMPSWREVCDDPKLNEETRKKLKAVDVEAIKGTGNLARSIRILNEYRQLRGMLDLSEKIHESLRGTKASVDKLMKQTAERLVDLQQSRNTNMTTLTFGVGNNAGDLVKQFMEPATQEDFIPTLFTEFDEENGGITNGALFTLGGSTGAGKSALASQLAINWSSIGEQVVIVPLEMSRDEMGARILSNITSIDIRKILYHNMAEDEKSKKYLPSYAKWVKKTKAAGGSYTVWKPDYDMNIEEILASVYSLNPRIVIIDYISLLKDVDGDDAWQKLGQVARYCKVWAESNHKIVVLLCQVSEEGVVRYARSIVEHSSYCWTFVATNQTREKQIMTIEQLKARNGRLFPFTLRAMLDVMQIRSMSQDELNSVREERKKGQDKKQTKKKPKDYLADIANDD